MKEKEQTELQPNKVEFHDRQNEGLVALTKFKKAPSRGQVVVSQTDFIKTFDFANGLYNALLPNFIRDGIYQPHEVGNLDRIGRVWAMLMDEKSDELDNRIVQIQNARSNAAKAELRRAWRDTYRFLAVGDFFVKHDSVNWNERFTDAEVTEMREQITYGKANNESDLAAPKPTRKKKNA